MCRCAAEGHGLVVDLVVLGQWLKVMILKIVSNLSNSMILCFCLVLLEDFTGFFLVPDCKRTGNGR